MGQRGVAVGCGCGVWAWGDEHGVTGVKCDVRDWSESWDEDTRVGNP